MFTKVLRKLATLGTAPLKKCDVEHTLRDVALAGFAVPAEVPWLSRLVRATDVTARCYGAVRACYDLGLIVSAPEPATVSVRMDRVQALLALVESWHGGVRPTAPGGAA